MKKMIILGGLFVGFIAFGQHSTHGVAACDCPSCAEKTEGEKQFTLPGLQELNTTDEHSDCEHASTESVVGEPAGHDHSAEEAVSGEPAECDHGAEEPGTDPHAGHNHGTVDVEVDPHAGHNHGADAGSLVVTEEIARKVGIQIHEAEAGAISKTVVFPAEIALNQDRSAAVSPRYASIIHEVFAEIGDKVKKGDVLASLENRETMAVYKLIAPLDGIVISKELAVGESAGEDKVLFEVADLSSVWANISIFPKYQHLIRKGASVDFIAHDGHSARGIVKFISPLISHETRTFTARCVLEGADEDFTPGAFVRARIATEFTQVDVRVEREAVQTINGETIVFIPAGHGYEARDVELGRSDSHSVEIKSGLKEGERYVAVGAFVLKAQMITSGLDPHAGHGH